MIVSRQLHGKLVRDFHKFLRDAPKTTFSFKDILQKYQLVIGEGDASFSYEPIAAAQTFAVPLPDDYAASDTLSAFFLIRGECVVEIVSPTHGTSNIRINGDTDAENGLLMWQGDVTSITIKNNYAGSAEIFVEYLLFKLPDLTKVASYQGGAQVIGHTDVASVEGLIG